MDLTPLVSVVAETIEADKWFLALAEPLRFKRLSISLQTTVAMSPTYIAPIVETIEADKWFMAWTEPRRFKRRAHDLATPNASGRSAV
jgi:phenylpyruvate tautomerase PptA (4-oxalocrotonate tautomerase family)